MTSVLRHSIPNLDGADRAGLRYLGRNHEGMARQQIVNGIASFSVTVSRGGVITIDICWKGSVNTARYPQQARQGKDLVNLNPDTCRY